MRSVAASSSAATTPEEREANFRQWLQQKELRDKALASQALKKLDSKRAEEDESFKEVAIAIYAIDKMLGVDETSAPADLGLGSEEEKPKKVQKSMKSTFIKWACEHHKFSNIKITSADYAAFSGAVREFLEKVPDGHGNDVYELMSLKYTFPAVPKNKGDKVKPLTSDQKQQNLIFMRCLKNMWRSVKEETNDRVNEYVSRAEISRAESKSSTGHSKSRAALEYNALYDMSMKRMKDWIEEDEDKIAEAKRQDRLEKITEAKIAHEQFVKQKDSVRIRVPDDLTPPENVKPGGLTTVELMAGTGLKYIHATGKGRQGVDGDLEKCRRQLLKMGHVIKENFDPADEGEFSMEKFHKELEENPVILEKKYLAEKAKEDSEKAYNSWLVIKDLKEQAVKLLAFLPTPSSKDTSDAADAKRSMTGSKVLGAKGESRASLVRSSMGSLHDKRSRVSRSEQIEEVIEVGKALKRVDRSLFSEWSSWCVPSCLSFRVATVLWDFFDPKACDVHSANYSQVRETFTKLLKPGVDYRQTFTDFATKLMRRRHMNADSKEEKDKYMGELCLSKTTLKDLLLEMGIAMKPAELLVLVDAFDANGDGVITMQEFLDFTGPKRDKKGGAAMQMNQRCSWLTTCKVTGMANGYTVSGVSSKTRLNAWGEDSKVNDSKASQHNDPNAEHLEGITGKIVIKTLKNGEKRMYAEMAERGKREELLRKFGLLTDDDSDDKKGSKDEEKDEYEDDYEDEPVAEGKGSASEAKDMCPFIRWTEEDRKQGIDYLMKLTAEARQEAWIQEKMSSGSPPSKANLELDSPYALKERDENFDPTTQLQLSWSPGSKDDLVSFFLLEFAGATGGLLRSENYKEVCRDPPNAGPDTDFECTYRMTGLEPGVSYAFRLRAYNGYGPGQFVYKTFTTLTTAPMKPRVMKLTHDAVQLRWIFSKGFAEKMAELKELFFTSDNDGNGTLSREELTEAVEKANPSVKAFLNEIAKKLKLEEWGLLFDKIEGDENGTLSWEEFEQFFMTQGWGDDEASVKQGSVRASSAMRMSTTSTQTLSGSSNIVSKVTYRIEKCISEKGGDQIFETVQDTNVGSSLISRLEPGQSYKFRVVGINADGQVGLYSDCVIVHTMLETPPTPTCSVRNILPTKIIISWKARHQHQSSRDKAVVNRLVGDWAGTAGTEESGVSVVDAFKKYDRDKSGSISRDEFAILLADLNVDTTPERLAEAFSEFDENNDGVISFEEFSTWWRRDEVAYVLKRSEPIFPKSKSAFQGSTAGPVAGAGSVRGNTTNNKARRPSSASRGSGNNLNTTEASVVSRKSVVSASNAFNRLANTKTAASSAGEFKGGGMGTGVVRTVAMPVQVYRGPKCSKTVSGLMPNTLYHFRLRYCGSKCNSDISNALVVMTAPLEVPQPPVLISVTSSMARVKWYPPKLGAYKFVVQVRGNDNAAAARLSSVTDMAATNPELEHVPCDNGWVTVFSAFENSWTSSALASDSEYEVRVFGLNCQGTPSKPSPTLKFRTLPRDANAQTVSVKSASSRFTIDCTHDIVVGDTILITERIFSMPESSLPGDTIATNADKLRGSVSGSKALNASRVSAVNTSTTNIRSSAAIAATGKFIGERTTACHVVKDNYRWLRDFIEYTPLINSASETAALRQLGGSIAHASTADINAAVAEGSQVPDAVKYATTSANITMEDAKRVANLRNLWLEVIWQRSSNDACKQFENSPGTIIQRVQSKIEEFQVYRLPWNEELNQTMASTTAAAGDLPGRRSQWREWTALADCYIQTDC